jgi:hypothetical protein
MIYSRVIVAATAASLVGVWAKPAITSSEAGCLDKDADFCHDRYWRGEGYAAVNVDVAGPLPHNDDGAHSPRRGAVHVPPLSEACTHNPEVQSKCACSSVCTDLYKEQGPPAGLYAPEKHDEKSWYPRNLDEIKGPRGYKPSDYPDAKDRPGMKGNTPYSSAPGDTKPTPDMNPHLGGYPTRAHKASRKASLKASKHATTSLKGQFNALKIPHDHGYQHTGKDGYEHHMAAKATCGDEDPSFCNRRFWRGLGYSTPLAKKVPQMAAACAANPAHPWIIAGKTENLEQDVASMCADYCAGGTQRDACKAEYSKMGPPSDLSAPTTELTGELGGHLIADGSRSGRGKKLDDEDDANDDTNNNANDDDSSMRGRRQRVHEKMSTLAKKARALLRN